MAENEKPGRNYGIDLLRLVTMFFICILHVCNKGGIVSHLSADTAPVHYGIAWFFEALTFGAVDIFGMISGYVGWNRRFRVSRPLGIWLELVFYTLIGCALMTFLCPELMHENAWLRAAMPVLHGEYWYMTAYFGMVFLTPFLNAAIQKMSVRSLGFSLLCLFVFFSVLPTVLGTSVFGLSSGYSTLWLCVTYLCGGFLSRLEKKPKAYASLLVFAGAVVVTWIIRISGVSAVLKYSSPAVVICAAAITLGFSQLRIRGRALKAVIGFAAPSALGIFIIHVHDVIWEFLLKDAAVPFVSDGAALMAVKIIAMAAVIFFGCFAVDLVRRGIFRIAHVKDLLKLVDRGAEKLYGSDKNQTEG